MKSETVKKYATTRLVCGVVTFAGGALVAIAVLVVLTAAESTDSTERIISPFGPLPPTLAGVGIGLLGLFLVICGQVMQAMLDGSIASQQTAQILVKIHETLTEHGPAPAALQRPLAERRASAGPTQTIAEELER